MGCFAGGDLSRIEVDTVERVEPGQSGGKMGEDKTVTGPHLDDPPSTAPTRNHLRDMVDDAGMMTQEEILETVRETIEKVRRRRRRTIRFLQIGVVALALLLLLLAAGLVWYFVQRERG